MQKCFGIGPAGMIDLPPALPVIATVNHVRPESASEFVAITSATAVILAERPPTPPPRSV
jgi:hypothetical protein